MPTNSSNSSQLNDLEQQEALLGALDQLMPDASNSEKIQALQVVIAKLEQETSDTWEPTLTDWIKQAEVVLDIETVTGNILDWPQLVEQSEELTELRDQITAIFQEKPYSQESIDEVNTIWQEAWYSSSFTDIEVKDREGFVCYLVYTNKLNKYFYPNGAIITTYAAPGRNNILPTLNHRFQWIAQDASQDDMLKHIKDKIIPDRYLKQNLKRMVRHYLSDKSREFDSNFWKLLREKGIIEGR